MATVTNTITLRDRMSKTMEKITERMRKFSGAASTAGKNIGEAMGRGMQRADREADRAFENMRRNAHHTGISFNNLAGAAIGLAAALGGVAALQGVTEAADTYANLDARLSMILEKGQTLEQLQDNIAAAAERARGSYVDMGSAVAKLSAQASKTFETNSEALKFVEIFQKVAATSGAGATEQASAMYQMTQALSGGVLQGEELAPITDAMSDIPIIIEKYMRAMNLMKPEERLKDVASESRITADIVRNAMFAAADDINKKFETMPTTFAQAFQLAKDRAMEILQPVLKDMIGWLNAGGAQLFSDILTNLAYVALGAAKAVAWLYQYIDLLTDVFVFGIGALVGYQLTVWAISAAMWVASGGVYALISSLTAMSVSLIVSTGGIYLIAIAIGFAILAAYKWVQSVGGIRNAWAICIDAIIGWWNDMKINFVELTGFILTLMDNLAAGVAIYFQNMVNDAIANLNKLIGLANKIPGVEIAAVGNMTFADDIGEKAKADIESRAAYVAGLRAEAEASKNQRKLVRESAAAERASKQADTGLGNPTIPATMTAGGPSGTAADPITTKTKGEVSISDEDLKYMRDLARVQFINKITTLRPSVNATFGDIRETADVNKIISAIAGIVEESTASALT